jgi:hypothetical protein
MQHQLHFCPHLMSLEKVHTESYFGGRGLSFFFVFSVFGAGIKPRALHMLGKHFTTELHPSPEKLFLYTFLTVSNC